VPGSGTKGQKTGVLIVVSGPSAGGKTTVGHEIALHRDRAIHIDGDLIQGLIVTGSITMTVPPSPAGLHQLRLRFRAALAVANLYRDAGFDAIISDNLFEEEAQRFLAAAVQSHPSQSVRFVMLNPSIEAVRERYNRRPGGGYTATLTPEHLKAAVERTARVGLWLDTSDQTAAQTADEVLRRLDEAEVGALDGRTGSAAGQDPLARSVAPAD
jgi:chloramphenicol 3-O-phosphotransferase